MAMGARQNFGRARRSQSAPRGRRNLHHFEALAPRLVLADSVGPIEFSVDGGMFKDAFQLELAGPPDTVVRYTTDGSQPDETSTTYEQPISIVDPTWIRARAFDADGAPGPHGGAEILLMVGTAEADRFRGRSAGALPAGPPFLPQSTGKLPRIRLDWGLIPQ